MKITKTEVERRMKKHGGWRWLPDAPSYEQRCADFYATGIQHRRHTHTKQEHFRVIWYTGNEARRWNDAEFSTMRQAIEKINAVRPEANRIAAEETGDSGEKTMSEGISHVLFLPNAHTG
jgi:hypothetical protein